MDWFEFTQNVVAALVGGGVAGGIITLYIQNRYTKEGREAAFLREQLAKIYGPLMFHIESIDVKGDHFQTLIQLGDDLYGGISEQEQDPESDPYKWLSVVNECGLEMSGHCMEMVDVLKDNYSYVDPDDVDVFSGFIRSRTLWTSVIGDDGTIKVTDDRLRELLGVPTWRDEQVRDRVKEKFLAKQKRLKELGG